MRLTTAGFVLAIALAGAGAALAQDQTPAAVDAPPAAPDAGAPPPAPADTAPLPPPQVPTNPAMTGPRLLIATSMGDITLQLDSVRAPKTVANVLAYVKARHYDGTVIYRVVKGFVLEMGSWDANVKGRPPLNAGVALEANNGLKNLRGTVSLAHGDNPGSGQADFFINLDDNTSLDPLPYDKENKSGYAVFGKVASGMEVVDRIALVPVGDHGPMPGAAPVTPIVIKKVSVLPATK